MNGFFVIYSNMKHYNSIPRIQDDGTLKGEEIWAILIL